MRFLFLLLFFISSVGYSQTIFLSPYTESWPDVFRSRIDEIDRSISIGHSEIVIITDTQEGKRVETLLVESMKENNLTVVFRTRTKEDGKPAMVIVPTKNKIRIIDIFKPSPKTGEEEHLRFYVYRPAEQLRERDPLSKEATSF